MSVIEFELKEEFIPLIKLLKVLRLVETGGIAKMIVEDGLVLRNGEIEYRKRAKIRGGEVIEFEGYEIRIIESKEIQ